ncbi:hypothetical protein VCUG_02518 [Vavraia culicis subsp. floridensis]|uniref:Uncharacterized protein n=1 Tax=Vavraia culicis (isolate floridensis) TaxID=948595 RepID=L2GSC8_VAVCU|nr:uncharacterized protein VCUG_02518 [Vavraia culicis subsp. floridensis]ELA45985.1 hypothetical protein VCUG_02518 [Vavraia culicis subsp. floridensis]
MDIANLDHTCSQINLPYCRYIDKPAYYPARNYMIMDYRLHSLCTLVLLMVLIMSLVRLHVNIRKKYIAYARDELMLICDIYLAHLVLEFVLVLELFKSRLILTVQLSLINAGTFTLILLCIFCTALNLIHSYAIVRVLAVAYFAASLIFFLLFLNNTVLVFLNFIFNLFLVLLFVFVQLFKLVSSRAEVWSFGNLFISVLFLAMSVLVLFVGNNVICFVCEGYLDGLFVFHIFLFLSFLMLHKYWLSTCDKEVECTAIQSGS